MRTLPLHLKRDAMLSAWQCWSAKGKDMKLKRLTLIALVCSLMACDSGYAPIVSYTDPFNGGTRQVYASNLAIQYRPLDKPWNQPGFYDQEAAELEPQLIDYNEWRCGGFRNDPALQAFISIEKVKVLQWWDHFSSHGPWPNRRTAWWTCP